MGDFVLSIRGEIPASAGVPLLEMELLRRCVSDMYADAVIGGSSSCMLAGLEKSELQHWHECPRKVRPLTDRHFQLERRNLNEWLANS